MDMTGVRKGFRQQKMNLFSIFFAWQSTQTKGGRQVQKLCDRSRNTQWKREIALPSRIDITTHSFIRNPYFNSLVEMKWIWNLGTEMRLSQDRIQTNNVTQNRFRRLRVYEFSDKHRLWYRKWFEKQKMPNSWTQQSLDPTNTENYIT